MPINLGAIGSFLQGAGPNLQAQQNQRMQQGQQAALVQALQQYASQQNAQRGATAPMAPLNPAPAAATSTGAQAMPAATGAAPSSGGFGGNLPPIDQMMSLLSKSGLSPDQQFEALQKYGAFASPIEKYTQQLTMAQEKMGMASQMLDEKMKNAVLLQQMRGDTSSSNTDKRVAATERGQDTRADTAADAQDIAQQRADAYKQRIDTQGEQGAQGLNIKQQDADTRSDRAGTYKYGTMEGVRTRQQDADTRSDKNNWSKLQGQEKIDLSTKSLAEKNELIRRGQDKQYQAKLAAIAGRGTPQQQAQFKAAQSEFAQASAAYRNEKMAMNGTGDIKALADNAAQAQQKMESAAARIGAQSTPAPLVSTQAEYDKLPSGAQYKEPDGNTYTKP